jgi:peptidoglycan/LPS O-acetylase OafA/YrhL
MPEATPMHQDPGQEQRIRVLDGWRGVSVLFAVFGHLIHHSALSSHFDRAAGAPLLMVLIGTVLGSFAPLAARG